MKENMNFDCCKFCDNYKNNSTCTTCNQANKFQNLKPYLKLQTAIKNQYIIDKILFLNSASVTYLAFDKDFSQKYFITEYLPIDISKRAQDDTCVVPVDKKEAQYKALLIDFVDLHKTLLKLSLSGTVPIKEIFAENNTVYIIKKYIDLTSLENYLSRQPGNYLSWYKCKPLFLKLNSILLQIHKYGLIHRGICPKNIFFDNLNNIFIDGFCISCVRTANSELRCELYEGFSAPEQYQTNGWQDTWTDVYGVAATLYNVLTGKIISDKTKFDINKSMMPTEIYDAISLAIKTNHKERTQTINKFNSDLINESFSDKTAIYDTFNFKNTKKTEKKDILGREINMKQIKKIIIVLVLMLVIVLIFVFMNIMNVIKSGSKTERIDEDILEKNSWLFDESNSQLESDVLIGQSSQSSSKSVVNQDIKTLPNFVGEQIDDVKNNKSYQKFNFIVEREFSESTNGEIIHQEPLPGVSVKSKKFDVILKISQGPEYIKVPDILEKSVSEAVDMLENLGIKYEIVEVYNKNYKDNVINDMNKKPGEDIIKNKDILILRVKSSELIKSSASKSVGDFSDNQSFMNQDSLSQFTNESSFTSKSDSSDNFNNSDYRN